MFFTWHARPTCHEKDSKRPVLARRFVDNQERAISTVRRSIMPVKILPEPWLRGTLSELPAVHRAVVHALELAGEDLQRWCGPLSDEQLNLRPAQIAPVAFHMRHIARSLDRLLTYAEGASPDE